ncbi:MAG: imidazole glycerol phosphate synthase subunit HisH [Pseudohongiella sp.]|nr:imidazole glycerol phosphate synthase subunit HisH [Pseudohongiella sp.]
MTISIVDYGVGNLGSIQNMLKKLGAESVIAHDEASINAATKLILPGVGAFDYGMRRLEESGLRYALDHAVLVRKVPVAGICLGMQMMTLGSEEGTLPGLNWINAKTVRFSSVGEVPLKVPHMGWRIVHKSKESRILENLEPVSRFYFVHSFYVNCLDPTDTLLTASYGNVSFDAAFERDNIFGFQFHPEKSHRFGMSLLKAFVEFY